MTTHTSDDDFVNRSTEMQLMHEALARAHCSARHVELREAHRAARLVSALRAQRRAELAAMRARRLRALAYAR